MNGPGASGFVRPTLTNLDAAPWWQAMADGVLSVPECGSCLRRFFPPQPFCPHCGSSEVHLVPVSGEGVVYSWVVANRSFAPEFNDDVPYGIVAVDLVDGGRLIGRFAGDSATLRVDLPVRALVEKQADFGLLWFVEASE